MCAVWVSLSFSENEGGLNFMKNSIGVVSFPDSPCAFFHTASDGKLGGAWE